MNSVQWGYVRIISGTIFGGILGFYVMHRVELSYKEKMKERLRQYELELKRKEKLDELEDSI
ncbi:ATP-dependent helicase/nuclease subunit A isoform 1 [Gossypium australe]|uniref:ATP-dependent helicase/nuclease subunit A isoform 1 n=1 Tax=Gossypium australe TaxID=47621 RepID=A0A5B6US20_9ROSI|nr:ATP-dependent helicase/nuclease subunit A isoform 1 [Gossypium australe]